MRGVVVVVGSGSICQAIARRVGVGKTVLLADLRPENAETAAKVLSDAGYDARTASFPSGATACACRRKRSAGGVAVPASM
ncbi:hypothetical protein EDF57_102442 [Novosphingobium sp. PhB55]|uniref:hypothetical protein n=1 Tax=Novosphingobium sp. PhB55 TaxID=2485106 RepID=UPI0010F0F91A|nr:hypothetical protein [Novosphingobium sp. PhB55]TDW67556.1 hypothetical protein EDF57_102442 [Novosphingobium sp. PhB55]